MAMRERPTLTAWLIALVTVLVYLPVIWNDFVPYDVDSYIVRNPMVNQGLTPAGILWAFTETHSANWHPLTWLSHMVDVELYGLEPLGHHLTNVVLHALSAALLFRFFLGATGRFGASFFVAALFALHPLRVESVAWAAERKDVLSGLFWILGLHAWARYVAGPTLARYGLVLAALALGLMAKPMLVTFPFVLLLVDLWPLGRTDGEKGAWRKLALEKLPLLMLVVLSSAVTVLAQRAEGVTHSLEHLPLTSRLANAGIAYGAYAWKSLWPSPLAVFYPHPAMVVGDLKSTLYLPGAVGGLCVLATSVWLFLRTRRDAAMRPVLSGWLWFLGTLVPVIGIVQVGHQSYADRYAYIPLIGLHVALVFGIDAYARGQGRRLATVLGLLFLVVSGALTWRQIGSWNSGRALWEHCLAATENNYMAHHLYGISLAGEGEYDAAMAEFEKSLAARPEHFPAHHTWAEVLDAKGEPVEASRHWHALTVMAPSFVPGWHGFGRHYAARDLYHRAVDAYDRALDLDEGRLDVQYDRALALAKLDKRAEAERALKNILLLDRDNVDALNALAVLALQQGRASEALELFERVLAKRPQFWDARANMGAALAALERWEEAQAAFAEVISHRPNHADALRNLEVVRLRLGAQ